MERYADPPYLVTHGSPDAGATQLADGSHSRKRYGPGADRPDLGPQAWLPAEAERGGPARQTRSRISEAQKGDIRSRLFLASALRMQVRDDSEDEARVLECEICGEYRPGRARPAGTSRTRIFDDSCLAMPDEEARYAIATAKAVFGGVVV